MNHNLPDAIAADLAQGAGFCARAWIIRPRNLPALGFTDHDRDLVVDGLICHAQSAFEAGQAEQTIGSRISQAGFRAALEAEGLDADALAKGLYDRAAVSLYLVRWREPQTIHLLWTGHFGAIRFSEHAFEVDLIGLQAALERPIGRVYARQCDAIIGDARCGVDLDQPAFARTMIVAAILDSGDIRVTAESESGAAGSDLAPVTAGFFTGGAADWLSGANQGQMTSVLADIVLPGEVSGDARQLRLADAPARQIAAGDRLRLRAGCDKIAATCRDKFANITNFRGFPFLPGADALLTGPQADARRDGGSRHRS